MKGINLKAGIFFIFLSITQFLHANELSLCTIFQNEAKYLPEWIEFHEKQGVDHFYLYNNLSSDNFRECLDQFINRGLVTLTDWPFDYTTLPEFIKLQCGAYKHCVENYGHESTWIANIDTDEFLFCPDGTILTERLKEYADYGAVSVCWVMYGTSNVTIPPGEKIIDHLVMRAKEINSNVKTIFQPKYAEDITPHWVKLKDKDQVTEHKERFRGALSPSPSADLLRINHYWTRDLDFFYNVKLPRRERWSFDADKQIAYEKRMYEVYDPILSIKRM